MTFLALIVSWMTSSCTDLYVMPRQLQDEPYRLIETSHTLHLHFSNTKSHFKIAKDGTTNRQPKTTLIIRPSPRNQSVMASNQNQQPGLVAAHAEYAKGATEVRMRWPIPSHTIKQSRLWKLTDMAILYTKGRHRRRHRLAGMDRIRRAGQGTRRVGHEDCERGPRLEHAWVWQGRGGSRQGRRL